MDPNQIGSPSAPCAVTRRAGPGDDLSDATWRHDVIVHPLLQEAVAIRHVAVGGEDDNGDFLRVQVCFQCAKDLLAAQVGEEEAEDHKIGPDPADDVETDDAIAGRADLEPFTGETVGKQACDGGFVFDDGDVPHGPPPDGASCVDNSNMGGDGYG
jgi:hypothetical protein